MRRYDMGLCARELFAVLASIGLVGAVVAAEENTILLESAPGETITISKDGIYTSEGDLSFGALSVTASPVTFDFSPSRKVTLTGSTVFNVATANANVYFKGGEWDARGVGSFYCGSANNCNNNNVLFDGCVWTNLSRVYVGNYASNCKLTLDNASKVYAKDCFLIRRSNASAAEFNILGGSGLYFLSEESVPFRTDNDEGNHSGRVTVAGENSILFAPIGEFRFGYKTANHYLAVSNKASLVANKFIVGVNGSATGSQVLVADEAMFTAKEISIRNPGCGMTVSNATLVVDSTANNAIKVGYEGRTGGSFVLSGANAQIDYAPSGNVEVFAENGGGAEFRIENGANWAVVANEIAGKTSNSVFRITSNGKFNINAAGDENNEGKGVLAFGPGAQDAGNPASSVSNRLEVCDGGELVFKQLRFSGHGNAFVVSNGLVRCTTGDNNNKIQIGYTRSGWDSSYKSKDCALVLRGENGRIEAGNTMVQIQNGSVVKFDVPANGYGANIVPLTVRALSFAEGTSLEIDCEAFMHKGGKVTLVKTREGITKNDNTIDDMIDAVNASLPQGCSISLVNNNKNLMLTCSKRRFVFCVR